MEMILLQTKLYIPQIRPFLVPRPRLIQKLNTGLIGKLTLISAPAGFGKTTLVANHIASGKYTVGWLALDKDDNYEGRFLRYLIAVLQQAKQTIGTDAVQWLASRQTPSQTILTSLINDLDAINEEIVLVLDDYHFIRSQSVHTAVTFLLEHAPETFHLIIITRSDPPLPLARLRARGQMVELRAADLRFTESEAVQFLQEDMGLPLDAESVAVLTARTEGWIAGLQMAALSMRDREDLSGFIESFSGTNRYILDYLLAEVLAGQPSEIRHFLLCTAILERLTTPLCDAILANSAKHISNSSYAILDYLEQSNLFLIPLDDKRIWYRYHHLFADLLRAQGQKSLDTADITKLHIRAADWYGQNDFISEAIHHAALAGDAERVERFIKQNYVTLVSQGEMAQIRVWVGELEKEQVYQRPQLCLYTAYSHAWFGELDEAMRLLTAAEKLLESEFTSPEMLAIRAHLAYIQSRITAMRGDIQQAITQCLTARSYTPDGDLALQLDTQITLGYVYFLSGDFAAADRYLNEMIQTGKTVGAVINTVAAACVLARLHAVQGQLHQAYDTYQNAARFIQDKGDQHRGSKSLVEVGMADLLCEWNDLETALEHMSEGLALMALWDKADDLVLAYTTLARIHLAQGLKDKASEVIAKASHLIRTRGVFPEAKDAVAYAQVKLWLAQGELRTASRWVATEEVDARADKQRPFTHELRHIAQARIFIAQQEHQSALHVLAHLAANAESGGRTGRLVEIILLQALAWQGMGELAQAMNALTKSMALAKPEGYVRLFLDEERPLQNLLTDWLAQNDTVSLSTYANHLLSHFDTEPPSGGTAPKVLSSDILVEQLSPREIEVLQIMALGKTNKEIARQLVIAPGTVKAHTAAIYRKLDVANRTEAVTRARSLGFLS